MMPPTGNHQKQKKRRRPRDNFYHLAKEQGYRSRAAIKLLQLNESFRFLPTARAVLDLGAAPGGWLQVAVRGATAGALVVGVDLARIRPVRGAVSLMEDITATARCGAAVRRLMNSLAPRGAFVTKVFRVCLFLLHVAY
jgi:AdoMet-dependent rRNA methyltransferase SPB1